MNLLKWRSKTFFAALSLVLAAPFVGCHSYHVEATVENETGNALQLLEVDYPNATFGANSLAAGATLRYQFQIQGRGPLKVLYSTQNSDQPLRVIVGPEVHERQEGHLHILLLPDGRARFETDLTPRN